MDQSLLKKTMRTMALMVGACVTFVGTLTLVVLFVVGRAVSPPGHGTNLGAQDEPSPLAPAVKPDTPRAPVAPAPPRRSDMTRSAT